MHLRFILRHSKKKFFENYLKPKEYNFVLLAGMSAPRSRGKFGPLPEPRDIRLKVHDKSRPRHELKKFTHYLMFFGQMLSHDLQENVKSESE